MSPSLSSLAQVGMYSRPRKYPPKRYESFLAARWHPRAATSTTYRQHHSQASIHSLGSDSRPTQETRRSAVLRSLPVNFLDRAGGRRPGTPFAMPTTAATDSVAGLTSMTASLLP